MFLTQGITVKYSDYHDPRTHNIPMGIHFARSVGLLVSLNQETLLCHVPNSFIDFFFF